MNKNHKKVFTASGVMLDGRKVDVIATVRYGDECNNGRNSFSITGDAHTRRASAQTGLTLWVGVSMK